MATSDASGRSAALHASAGQAAAPRPAAPRPSAGARRRDATVLWEADGQNNADAAGAGVNVAAGERLLSVAAGAVLAGLGLARRDLRGLLMLGAGGVLAYRGTTGHCPAYEAAGLDTAHSERLEDLDRQGVHVTECFLIDKPAEELYGYWRDFEQLPKIMTHLKSVQRLDAKRSLWTATAPAIGGGQMRWEAELIVERPGEQLAWQTLPGSELQHRGAITFTPALGKRGTNVRVDLEYAPPAGRLGRWVAKLFGEEPQQQIRSDLRKFKQLMETGEIPTTSGQPRGTCHGAGRLFGN